MRTLIAIADPSQPDKHGLRIPSLNAVWKVRRSRLWATSYGIRESTKRRLIDLESCDLTFDEFASFYDLGPANGERR